MAFARPSLSELITRTTADLVSRLSITGQPLTQSVVRKLARTWSNAVNGLHGHITWGAAQAFISQADEDNLKLHGIELSMPELVAQFATGPVTFSGTAGASIPAGTLVRRSDGVQYAVNADTEIAGATVATVTAVIASAVGNAVAGVPLTLVSPLPNVSSSALVSGGGIVSGADAETPDHYRARMLARKRNTPQGGAAVDYEAWAKAALTAVTRVWVRPSWMGPGTVGVLFVCDGQSPITPTDEQIATVQSYIDRLDVRPVTAEVIVLSPELLPVDHTIQLTPNTVAVQAAVTAELADFYIREAKPGAEIAISNIDEAISLAEGERSHILVTPAAAIAPQQHQIPVPGVITFS